MNVAVLVIVVVAVMTIPLFITVAVHRRARSTAYKPRHTGPAYRPDQSLLTAVLNSRGLAGDVTDLGVVQTSQSADSDVIVASVTSIADRRPA